MGRKKVSEPVSLLPKQREFVQDVTSRELVYSGAFGAGKTRALVEKAIFYSLRFPGNRGLLCRKTLKSMRRSTIETFFDVCPPAYLWGGSKESAYNKSEELIRFENRSQIALAGLDDVMRVNSVTVSWVGVDEATELEQADWMQLLGRMRGKHMFVEGAGGREYVQQIFAATNPGGTSHWMYQRFFVDGVGRMIQTATRENTTLPPAYLESLDQFRGVYHKRYVEGNWLDAEGLVYDVYDPRVHVKEPFEIPASWPRFAGIDFGYTNPFVCLWAAVDVNGDRGPEGAVYVYREVYYAKRTVGDHAELILELEKSEKVLARWADHDAEDRETLHRQGIRTRRALKRLNKGIEDVYKALGPNPSKLGPLPKLYFLSNMLVERDDALRQAGRPTSTLEELPGYMWALPREGRNAKEEPVKANDHGADALRYLFAGIKRRFAEPFA